jgi:hypothetical protein
MDDTEREEYLTEVRRKGSTIGADLPEVIEIGGDEIELDEFLIETRKVDRIPPEAETKITEAKRLLRVERKDRLDRLENDPIDHETAETLVAEINGLDRALNALGNIRHPDYGERSREATVEDHKKWLGFIDDVSG